MKQLTTRKNLCFMSMMSQTSLVVFLLLSTGLSGCGIFSHPAIPPGPKPKEVRLKDGDTVVIQAIPYSGLVGAHYRENGLAGAYSRIELGVEVPGHGSTYVLRVTRDQISALDRQLQRETPVSIDLEFIDPDLYGALAVLNSELDVTVSLYYSYKNKVELSQEPGKFTVVK